MTDAVLTGDLLVVRTQANRESYAAENIARYHGDSFYLPQVMETIRKLKGGKRVREFRLKPLFPTYLFVKTAHGQWHHLLRTYGVLGVVSGTAGRPATLKARDLARLRSLEENGVIQLPKVKDGLVVGDKAVVTRGAYTGFVGLVEEMGSNERVKLLLDYMGRKVPFLVREADLEEVEVAA